LNNTSVINRDLVGKDLVTFDPCVLPLKVTQDQWNQHRLPMTSY